MTLLTPASIADIGELLRQPGARYIPCGSGSKCHWGSRGGGVYLSTARLNRVIAYAPADLTVTVEAGLKLQELQGILTTKGQFWPVDPLYPDQATVGGVIATADTGSLRYRYGGVRDLVLGIEFVRADGQVAKAGGRVVKNVAGYDLMKLLTGSRGRLALITQVTLRLYPLPRAIQQQLWLGSLMEVGSLADRLAQSTLTPAAVDLLSPALLDGHHWGIQVTWHGLVPELDRDWIGALSAGVPLPDLTSPWPSQAVLVKFGIPPAAGIGILGDLIAAYPQACIQWHRRPGLGRLGLAAWDPESVGVWRRRLQQVGGFLQVLAAPDWIKEVDPDGIPPAQQALEARLKQLWDPQGRFGE
ncbi:MAG: FAD-binding oxidoreductase [Thermostichales cyanobacterium SZTDM-1c_bins_54]